MTLEKLLAKTVPELKERYLDRAMAVPDGLLEALESDGRNGTRELARKIRERRRKNRAALIAGAAAERARAAVGRTAGASDALSPPERPRGRWRVGPIAEP